MEPILITHRPRPIFPLHLLPSTHHQKARDLLSRLNGVLGHVDFDESADPETSWEELFRLDAALTAFDPLTTWVAPVEIVGATPTAPAHSAIGHATHLGGVEPLPAHYRIWGPGVDGLRARHDLGNETFSYWDYKAYQEAAGREHIVCGYWPDDDSLDVVQAAQQVMHQSDHDDRFFVKSTKSKVLAGSATLQTLGGSQVMFMDNEDCGAGMWRLEGKSNCLIVQPYIEMSDEYRFFIVNGIPCAGSSKIMEFTPFEHQQQFDQRVKKGDSITPDPELVDQYLELARRTAANLHDEDPSLRAYTMDVARTAKGLVVVELNTLGASGLFAIDPVDVAREFCR